MMSSLKQFDKFTEKNKLLGPLGDLHGLFFVGSDTTFFFIDCYYVFFG